MAEIFPWLTIVAPRINKRENGRKKRPLDPEGDAKTLEFKLPCRAVIERPTSEVDIPRKAPDLMGPHHEALRVSFFAGTPFKEPAATVVPEPEPDQFRFNEQVITPSAHDPNDATDEAV